MIILEWIVLLAILLLSFLTYRVSLHTSRKVHRIMLTNDELATKLDGLATQLAKVKTEFLAAVANLKQVPPNVEAALGKLEPLVQELDDLNLDTETPTP